MKNLLLLLVCCVLISGCGGAVSPRERMDFNDDWKFHLGDVPDASSPDFDDSSWRLLDLPHDWAIEGDFNKDNPSGIGGGALPGGTGWYRKTFFLSEEDSSSLFRLDFDGVYMNAEVFVNGHLLGKRPYGYISFGYDMTPYLEWGGQNTVAVRVDNSLQPNSRWYSGCGIYRNVWLVKTGRTRIAPDGIYVVSRVDHDKASLIVNTELLAQDTDADEVVLRQIIYDASGKLVDKVRNFVRLSDEYPVGQTVAIADPHLWSPDDPYLYTLVTDVESLDGELLDRYETRTGIRFYEFSPENGFSLNGIPLKINGVCLHHDFGCLGSAFNINAARRQLEIMKEMGCNAIRTAHNPPAPQLLDLCDEMGFIVQDEVFDMWRKGKTAYDYSLYFDEWHERDLTDFIRRDRNHPSVFMWSIGNEVQEQWSGDEADMILVRKLADIVRRLDPTRPVTAGCNEPALYNSLFRSDALDIVGFNYHNQEAADVRENFPDKPFIFTESNSALMTRGYYRMPSDQMFIWPERWDIPFFDDSFSCSSYDNCHVPWGSTHEETLKMVRDNDFISGQFVWTGFDYIGEPTPYGWPARSSYFGIVDLAGFPKDVYYLYQSEWTDKDVLHLFPHWNWTEGQEVDMWCYYNNADEVELYVNGTSYGTRSKTDDCLHAAWRVVYEPGIVEVVARKDGVEVGRTSRRTAGEPSSIHLTMKQYGKGVADDALVFVEVEIVDKDGNLCPLSENLVNFEVDGGGAFIAGTDNGNPVSMERFKSEGRKAFYGKCLVVLQAEKAGKTVLKATSHGLDSAGTVIVAK